MTQSLTQHRYKLALTLALLLSGLIFSRARAQEPIIGEIRLFAGSTPPAGWLICDGSGLEIADYFDLYSVIGSAYTEIGPPEFFNLPDLRGRVPVGRLDSDSDFDALGDYGGEKTHTLTVAEMPSHAHPNRVGGDPGGSFFYRGYTGGGITNDPGGLSKVPSTAIGGGQPHNNLQPYQVVNYIIYTGVGLPTPTPTSTPTATLTPTATPTGTVTPPTATATPISGTIYIPSVYSQTLSSGNILTVPLQMSAGEALISMALLSVITVVVLQFIFRVVYK